MVLLGTHLGEIPPDAYQRRAANNPVPYLIEDHHRPLLTWHTPEDAMWLATQGICFFPDTSEYQPPVNSSFPYLLHSFRFSSGFRTDTVAAANWNYHKQALLTGRTRVVFAYAVFIPGQLASVMASLRAVFGAVCPTNRLVLMIDMESGAGFAGPGNHSAEANAWAQAFADYSATTALWQRSTGYANGGDWASNWPQYDPRLKRTTAAYNAKFPNTFSWQYAGGNPTYPVPAGYARTCAPWTDRYIDMNMINMTIDALELTLGITDYGDEMLTLFRPDLATVGPNQGWQRAAAAVNAQTNPYGYIYYPTFSNEGGIQWIPSTELNPIVAAINAGKPGVMDLGPIGWQDCMVKMVDKYGAGGYVPLPIGSDLGAGKGYVLNNIAQMTPLPPAPTLPTPPPVVGEAPTAAQNADAIMARLTGVPMVFNPPKAAQ